MTRLYTGIRTEYSYAHLSELGTHSLLYFRLSSFRTGRSSFSKLNLVIQGDLGLSSVWLVPQIRRVLSVTPAAVTGNLDLADPVIASVKTGRSGVRWSSEKLLVRVRRVAAEVAPWRSPSALMERQYELLEGTADYELWVIHWPVGVGLLLHDHGAVRRRVPGRDGALEETSTLLRGRRLRRRLIEAGQGKAFGPDHVHSWLIPTRPRRRACTRIRLRYRQ